MVFSTVKLVSERVEASMASLKVAVILVLVGAAGASDAGTVKVTVGLVVSPSAVVNDQTRSVASAKPVVFLAAVVMVAVHVVLSGSGAVGVRVAVRVPASYVTVAATGVPDGHARVKLVPVGLTRVVGSIGALKVAVTVVVVATPVAAGVVTGDVDVTVGAMPAPGVPRIGSPSPQAATKLHSSKGIQVIPDVKRRWSWFIETFRDGPLRAMRKIVSRRACRHIA